MTARSSGGQSGYEPAGNGPAPDVHRIRLISDGHWWSFVFTPADATEVLKRVGELARDPIAPLSATDARQICARLTEVRSANHSPPARA